MPAEDIYQPRVSPGATAGLPQAGADAFGAGVGAGLEQAGAAVGRIADVERDRRQRSEALASGLEAERAKVEIAKANRARLDAPGGWDGYNANAKTMAQQAGERIAKTIASPRVREKFENDWGHYAAGLDLETDTHEAVVRGQAEIAGLDEQANIANGRVAASPSDETFGDVALSLRESARATHAPAAAQDRFVADRLEQLKLTQLDTLPPEQAKAQLESGAADVYLSPATRRQIGDSIEAKIARAVSQRAAQARQAAAAEKEAIQTALVEADSGRPDPKVYDGIAARQEALGETSGALQSRLKAQEIRAAEAYRGATAPERDARIATLAAKPTRSAAEGVELKGLQGQASYLDKLGTLDRAAYATGTAVAPLNLSDPASIQRRVAEVAATQQQFGGKGDFFQPAETEQVQGLVHGTLDDRVLAARIVGQAGRFGAGALDQVAGSDRDFRAAATLSSLPGGDQLVRDALTGAEALKANPLLLTPAKDETGHPVSEPPQRIFDGRMKGALAGVPAGFGDVVRTNSQNIYLTLARKRGLTNFDKDTYVEAMNLALGGTRTASGWAGGVHLWRGQPVVLPRGMLAGEYQMKLSRANGQDWRNAGNGQPPSDAGGMYSGELSRLTPVMVRDGIYSLRAGNGFIMLKDGRTPFMFDVRRLPGVVHVAPLAPPTGNRLMRKVIQQNRDAVTEFQGGGQ